MRGYVLKRDRVSGNGQTVAVVRDFAETAPHATLRCADSERDV